MYFGAVGGMTDIYANRIKYRTNNFTYITYIGLLHIYWQFWKPTRRPSLFRAADCHSWQLPREEVNLVSLTSWKDREEADARTYFISVLWHIARWSLFFFTLTRSRSDPPSTFPLHDAIIDQASLQDCQAWFIPGGWVASRVLFNLPRSFI